MSHAELEPLLKRADIAITGRRNSDVGMLNEGLPVAPERSMAGRAWKNVCRATHRATNDVEILHNEKLVFYDHEALLTWRVFLMLGKSVFAERPVWMALLSYAGLAITSACLVAGVIPGARKLNTQHFFYLSTFLKVFITFMLGIYTQRSFTRWWSTMSEFRAVLVSVKQLIYACYIMSIRQQTALTIQRFSLSLCYILGTELKHAQDVNKAGSHTADCIDKTLDWLVENSLLYPGERDELEHHDGHSKFGNTSLIVWSWIGETIKHLRLQMAEEGTPLMPPMFIRLMSTCQDLMTKIENLKLNIVVQVPMHYAHLLALLVHLNNILVALLTGMTMGSAVAEIRDRLRHLHNPGDHGGEAHLTAELYMAMQSFTIALVTVLVEPTIYLAFLKIAHMLQYPFGEGKHHLPVDFFIARLHVELVTMWNGWKSGEELHHHKPSLDADVTADVAVAAAATLIIDEDKLGLNDDCGDGGGDAGGDAGGEGGDDGGGDEV